MQYLWSRFTGMDPVVVASIIAFVGVIVSAIISTIISRRSSYMTAVTAERSKWIDKLRGNIAELLGICSGIRMALPDVASEEACGRRETLDRLIALIRMQLNPDNRIDANMIGLLGLFPERVKNLAADYRSLEAAFVRHAQFLLKEEWEKVKLEAMGMLFKPCWYKKRNKRTAAYESFCTTTDSLVDRIPGPLIGLRGAPGLGHGDDLGPGQWLRSLFKRDRTRLG